MVKGRSPSLSAGRVLCLGGLAGANPGLTVDACDHRHRLWRNFHQCGFGDRRPAGAFSPCETLMLPPRLAGVHSREFPGQWWKYESLRGFASNRLTVEEVMNCLESQLIDHDICPQVLIGHKPAQVPGAPSECSDKPILTMDERVGVMRNLLKALCSPPKDIPHSGRFPQEEGIP